MGFVADSRSCAAAAAIATVLVSSGCATSAPSVDRHVFPSAGATWTLSQRNTGSYGKDAQFQVTRRDGAWQGRQVVTFPNSMGGKIVATADTGNWIAIVGPNDAPIISWDPPVGFQYPLEVGRSFSRTHRMTIHPTNRTVTFDYSCRPERYGDVTVKAGTFAAYEVACSSGPGNTDRFWYSPDLGIFVKTSSVRAADHPLGAGTQDGELVSHTIRR